MSVSGVARFVERNAPAATAKILNLGKQLLYLLTKAANVRSQAVLKSIVNVFKMEESVGLIVSVRTAVMGNESVLERSLFSIISG